MPQFFFLNVCGGEGVLFELRTLCLLGRHTLHLSHHTNPEMPQILPKFFLPLLVSFKNDP
jgi:hypothetical protein